MNSLVNISYSVSCRMQIWASSQCQANFPSPQKPRFASATVVAVAIGKLLPESGQGKYYAAISFRCRGTVFFFSLEESLFRTSTPRSSNGNKKSTSYIALIAGTEKRPTQAGSFSPFLRFKWNSYRTGEGFPWSVFVSLAGQPVRSSGSELFEMEEKTPSWVTLIAMLQELAQGFYSWCKFIYWREVELILKIYLIRCLLFHQLWRLVGGKRKH